MDLTVILLLTVGLALLLAMTGAVMFSGWHKTWPDHLVIILLLFSPFAGAIPLELQGKTPFIFFSDILLLVLSVFLIALWVYRRLAPKHQSPSRPASFQTVGLLFLAYIFFSILSLVQSPDILRSLVTIKGLIESSIIFLLVWHYLHSQETGILHLVWFFPWITLSLAAVTVISSYFTSGLDFLSLASWPKGYQIKNEIRSYLGNSNYLGGLLALTLPLSAAAVKIRRKRRVLLSLIFFPAVVLGLIVTSSRGAVVALLLSTFTVNILFYPAKDKLLTLSAFTLAFAGAIVFFPLAVENSYWQIRHSLEVRTNLFEQGWELFLNNPFLGLGRGISRNEFPSTDVHNSVLTAFLESGIGGGFAFVCLLSVVLWRSAKNCLFFLHNPTWSPVAKGIFISLVTGITHSQMEPLFERNTFDLFFWTLAGLAFALPIPKTSVREKAFDRPHLENINDAFFPGPCQ